MTLMSLIEAYAAAERELRVTDDAVGAVSHVALPEPRVQMDHQPAVYACAEARIREYFTARLVRAPDDQVAAIRAECERRVAELNEAIAEREKAKLTNAFELAWSRHMAAGDALIAAERAVLDYPAAGEELFAKARWILESPAFDDEDSVLRFTRSLLGAVEAVR